MGYYGNESPATASDDQVTSDQTTATDPLDQAEEPESGAGDGIFRRIIG
jgi:hypothetical protein